MKLEQSWDTGGGYLGHFTSSPFINLNTAHYRRGFGSALRPAHNNETIGPAVTLTHTAASNYKIIIFKTRRSSFLEETEEQALDLVLVLSETVLFLGSRASVIISRSPS
ncbi:hypothetical protein MHYP_G00020090 [Metynnis hypsauchen]